MKRSRFPDIKEQMWYILVFYLENYKKNFNIFKTSEGTKFLSILLVREDINKYQWKVKGSVEYSMLEIYIKHFLESFLVSYIKSMQNPKDSIKVSKEFINSQEFADFYETQFNLLEEVLLCSKFVYKILIPTFRIYFPEDREYIEFDSDHRIRNIYGIKLPYGNDYSISKFKEAPKYWFPYGSSPGSFSKANVSFEVLYTIKKKISSESPYNEAIFVPYAPLGIVEPDFFNEKVLSIFDFFTCFSPEFKYLPFTFSHKYYIELPPFSQNYKYLSKAIGLRFSYPAGMLNLKSEENINSWISCWTNNYFDFFKKYYNMIPNHEHSDIFRYTLETIRTIDNIPYLKLKNFLLVSTLEGILFVDSIKNKLKSKGSSKKDIIAKVFAKISTLNNMNWLYRIGKYFTESDLENFIISAYQYRNNIAHPQKRLGIDFEPKFLYSNEPEVRYEYVLAALISEWFKKFLRFLVNTWVKKNIKTQNEWYIYIDSLF
jgi:hypothetical protein